EAGPTRIPGAGEGGRASWPVEPRRVRPEDLLAVPCSDVRVAALEMVERGAVARLEEDVREVAPPDQPVGPEPIVDGAEEAVAVFEGVRPFREVVEAGRLDEDVRTIGESEERLECRGARPRGRIGVGEMVDDQPDVGKAL